jgi:serine/threonine protein kinase
MLQIPDASLVKEFRSNEGDYEILRDTPLGSGRWSNVYLAKPSQSSPLPRDSYSSSLLTPPSTPTLPSSHKFSSPPEFFALKIAANRACVAALRHEAAILTYLSSKPGHMKHIVPFHGYDERCDALIFTALPANLETVMTKSLLRGDEASRTSTLADVLPRLSRSLIASLAWLHSNGVVHADIKPANILLRSKQPIHPNADILSTSFEPILADFTSSFRLTSSAAHSSADAATFGGGTYEYLAPELLSRPCPPSTRSSDVYAMAITILTLIIGTSPFSAAAGNRFQLLEMIKIAKPIEFAMQDYQSEGRISDVARRVKKATGIDVLRFLQMGLRKDAGERVRAEDWLRKFA